MFVRRDFWWLLVMTALVGCSAKEGQAGASGAQGPAGMVGPTGALGPQGPQGVAGQVLVVLTTDGGTVAVDGGVAIVTGPPGASGASVSVLTEAAGSNCVAGGIGVSLSGQTTYVCNGLKGDAGEQGPQGIQGATGPQGIQGIQGAQGPRRVLLDGNGAVVGPMISPNDTFLPSAGCSMRVIGQNMAVVSEVTYFAQSGCVGAAYGYGVSDNCLPGLSNTLYARISPMSATSIAPLSYFDGAACQVFTPPPGGGSYQMLPLKVVSLPGLQSPFTIVTQ